jgi:glycosyltransferase involved in cell wall biosynthesis
MTLRLAVIIHDYYPRVGGAQALLRAQAPLLKERGAEVTILTRRFPGTLASETLDGISIHRLPIPAPKPLASLTFTLSGLSLLRRLRPDVIHANEFISPATTAMLAKRWLGGIPIVITPHRSGPLGDVQRLQNRRGGLARLNALREQVDAFVVISNEIGDELRGIGVPPQKMHFINNGVDTTRFAPPDPAHKLAIRQTLGIAPDALAVIYTGRLVREKRLNNLLAVWPTLRAAFSKAELVLLGAGDQESALRQMAVEGVHFPGPQSDVVPYLQAADIFVLPSEAEGFSIAMLEAMSCGLAPIITNIGGATEVITEGQNGLLVAPDDLPALQNALTKLLQDAHLRTDMGLAARKRVQESYSVQISVEKLFQLYNQLANSHK